MLCAAIVESRDIDIEDILNKHVPFLPKDVEYFLFTTEELKEKYSQYNINVIDVKMEDESIHGYNLFLTRPYFWSHFLDFDRVLIFQHDSGLLRSGIEEFYEYDYVGAPWKGYPYVGNGGLSLRNPKTMMDVLSKFTWGRNKGEDMFFSECILENKLGNLAPIEVAKKFSVESVFELGTLGYHKPWYYLPSQWQQIKDQYK
jgi:hypothetical protein